MVYKPVAWVEQAWAWARYKWAFWVLHRRQASFLEPYKPVFSQEPYKPVSFQVPCKPVLAELWVWACKRASLVLDSWSWVVDKPVWAWVYEPRESEVDCPKCKSKPVSHGEVEARI